MPLWNDWLNMAEESLLAAGKVEDTAPRSSASRYYYAAYQSASALLLYSGVVAPADREAWSHEDTPRMIVTNINGSILSEAERKDLRSRLVRLYKVRIEADYHSGEIVILFKDVRRNAQFIFQVVRGVTTGGR